MKNCENQGAPVKKNGFKIIIASLILISVTVGTMLSFSYISNGLKRTFMSSESYFRYVVRQNLKQNSDIISLFISDIKKNIVLENKTEEKSLIISMEEEFSDIIGDFDFYKDINWLRYVKLDTKFTENDGNLQGSANLYLNKKPIASLDCTADGSSSYLSMPQYNGEILITDLNNSPLKTGKILSAIPEKETLSDIITRYVNVVLENIAEVRKNNEVVKINGLEEKCHKLSATLENETWQEILEMLKRDRDILGALKTYSKSFASAPEYEKIYDSFAYTLDKYIQNTEGAKDSSIEIYVDGKGKIIGAGFIGENSKTEYLYIEKEENYGISVTMSKDVGRSYTLEGGGTVRRKTVSGEYTLSVETLEILDIDLQSADVSKLKSGIFDGKINIRLSDNIKPFLGETLSQEAEDLTLGIVSVCDNKESTFNASLYNKGKLCMSLNLLSKTAPKKEIKLPDEENIKNAVNYQEWIKSFNLMALAENLTEAEVPLSLILKIK